MWNGLLMRDLNMRIILLSILYCNFKDNNAHLQRLGLRKVATSHWRHIILNYRRACIDIFFKRSAVVVETWLSLLIINQSHLVRNTVSHAFYTFVSDVCENRHKHIRRHHTHPRAHHTSERARTHALTHTNVFLDTNAQQSRGYIGLVTVSTTKRRVAFWLHIKRTRTRKRSLTRMRPRPRTHIRISHERISFLFILPISLTVCPFSYCPAISWHLLS